jgi:hypothetical protein
MVILTTAVNFKVHRRACSISARSRVLSLRTIHLNLHTYFSQIRAHTKPNTAIAPLIMAELRVDGVALAVTDVSWKTHMSQVGCCAHQQADTVKTDNTVDMNKPQISKPKTYNLKPPACMLRTSAHGMMVLLGVMRWTTI